MRVILVGYGEMLYALALGILDSGHEIAGVVRSETLQKNQIHRISCNLLKPSSDYMFIKTHSLYEISVKSVNTEKFREYIKKLNTDIVIVGSCSEKFSIETLNTMPDRFVNVHPSLLPRYRGPNPYIHIILNNEQQSGITFHLMNTDYDSGAILLQKEVPLLPNDTGGSLKLRCCKTAHNEVGFLLNNFKSRLINRRYQDESKVTYYPQLPLKETIIEFSQESAVEINKRIRALSPWQKCYLPIQNKFFSFSHHIITTSKSEYPTGTIINKTKDSIFIVCKDSAVIKFSNLKILCPFSMYLSKFFWSKIRIGDKVL